MLKNQKHLFNLAKSTTYLNAAFMSPQLKSISGIGIQALRKKESPDQFGIDDFFEPRNQLKKRFASLIDAKDSKSIAIIPSASYGVSTVANNIKLKKGQEILICEGQFPSHVYPWYSLAEKYNGKVVLIKAPKIGKKRGKKWNLSILESISKKTKVVALPQVHWADGTVFDLKTIRKKCDDVGAKLIIDGTQSVGAASFSVRKIKPDALICAGYKWLMGPYGFGVAYFDKSFWNGDPIEYNWMNRKQSSDFANLTNYQSNYMSGAERFSMGGASNFIMVPMLSEGIRQVIKWGPANIQNHCKDVVTKGIDRLRSKGCFIEDEPYRMSHLFGVYLPKKMDKTKIRKRLMDKKVHVSFRGDAIRISPHVYNDSEDFNRFVECVY